MPAGWICDRCDHINQDSLFCWTCGKRRDRTYNRKEFKIDGRWKTIPAWADDFGLPYSTMYRNLIFKWKVPVRMVK